MIDTLWLRWRWPLLAAALALVSFMWLVTHEHGWTYLGIDHLRPYFADTVAVLSGGEAWHEGLDPYAMPNPFDPFGRPHVYGPWWLVTGALGLKVADAQWLGPLLLGTFLVAAVALLAPRGPAATLVTVLLLVSPPLLLAQERGNNDLVVFLLLGAGGALLFAPARPARGVGAGLIGLAAVLKIYPVAALPALAVPVGPRRRVFVRLAALAVGCLLVFIFWRHDFLRLVGRQGVVPQPETVFSYGAASVLFAWEAQPLARGTLLASGLTVAVILLGGLARYAGTLLRLVPTTGMASAWFVAGALAWIFCFVANTNYTYRAVLLLLPARLWLEAASAAGADGTVAGRVARIQLAAWLLVFWLGPIKGWWAVSVLRGQVAGAPQWLAVILGLEQVLVWGLTVALALSVAGWLWRRWHDEVLTTTVTNPPSTLKI